MLTRASRFAARNAVGLLALFVALGGVSYAATGGFVASSGTLVACVGESHVVVLKTGRKACHKGQKTVVWNQQGPSGARGAAGAGGAAGAAGAPGANGFSALSTLPSGASESGDFTVSTGPEVGFMNFSASYSIPLAAPLDSAHTVYTTTKTASCPGPGTAAPGFLCVYSANRENAVITPIYNYESGTKATGSGRFGWVAEWTVNPLAEGFDVGSWTVTGA
jgi:hypothetical protein